MILKVQYLKKILRYIYIKFNPLFKHIKSFTNLGECLLYNINQAKKINIPYIHHTLLFLRKHISSIIIKKLLF